MSEIKHLHKKDLDNLKEYRNKYLSKENQSALKLQELVKVASKSPSEETCFGIPVNAGLMSALQSLIKDSEK